MFPPRRELAAPVVPSLAPGVSSCLRAGILRKIATYIGTAWHLHRYRIFTGAPIAECSKSSGRAGNVTGLNLNRATKALD
jgi:hypothetical protein